jgi:hypothetical protein
MDHKELTINSERIHTFIAASAVINGFIDLVMKLKSVCPDSWLLAS